MTVLSDRVDVLESTNANLVSILQNLQGTLQAAVDAGQGPSGWSPVLTVQSDGSRRVLQVTDWTGGGGTKPATGEYIGSSGLVATAGAAIDIRGAAGANGSDGDGWTGASYDSGTGIVTFTSDDGLGFTTGDIRGDKGDPGALFNWTGPWADQTTYVEGDGAERGGSSYVATADHTADSTTEPGVGASWGTVWDLTAAAGDKGNTGDGFTGGSYDAGTGVVTFTSDDGLGFSTGDLRGADGTGSGTVTSVDITGGTGLTSSGGPVTSSGAINVELDGATQTSLGKADTATQPGDLGTAAPLDVPASGDAAGGEVVKGDDTRLSDARTPTSHNHTLADITDSGTAAASDATDFATPDDVETATVNAQTGTTYTLALSDRGQVVTMDNSSANTATVPTNSSVAFDVGSVVTVIMKGAGTTTVEGATGVTVNGTSAGTVDISAQWQGVSLLKIATDEWIASGAI